MLASFYGLLKGPMRDCGRRGRRWLHNPGAAGENDASACCLHRRSAVLSKAIAQSAAPNKTRQHRGRLEAHETQGVSAYLEAIRS
jgi:hypothetical protein